MVLREPTDASTFAVRKWRWDGERRGGIPMFQDREGKEDKPVKPSVDNSQALSSTWFPTSAPLSSSF